VTNWRAIRNRALVTVHRALFRASQGRLIARLVGMDVVMITTTGARTGRRRRTMLTVPVRDQGRLVLVASNGGNPREPDWCANLRAHPEVEVADSGRTSTMIATIASSEERARLWPQVVSAYRGYAAYQERSPREIPLVLLSPH
jgi:deazaflavin-dependent oxidoreductase (nitroreductase family)